MKGLSPVQSASETDQISGIAPRTAKAHRRSMAQVIAMPPPAERDDLPTRIARRPNALTVAELSELLHVSANYIYDLTGAGRIPCYRIRGCIRFDPVTVACWLRQQAA